MIQQKSTIKSIFVILMLCVALGFVIYAARYTQSNQFIQNLELFFGAPPPPQLVSNRLWNWCPQNTQRIEFYVKRASEDQVVPEQICEITIEPVPEEKANLPMKRYLTVGSGTESKTLEADEALEIFKIEGLIFKSKSLSKTLKGY